MLRGEPEQSVRRATLGIFGAYLVGVKLIGIDAGAFWSNMQAGVDFRFDIVNGVIKSVVFGVAVSMLAVFEGYDAKPTAEGVSLKTRAGAGVMGISAERGSPDVESLHG